MASSTNVLSPLQHDLLAVVRQFPAGYVTGGTALAGYLGHRHSLDIDYFVSNAADVDLAGRILQRSGPSLGLTINETRRFPGFRRYEVLRGEERTMVDIVHEVVPQVVPL